MIATVYSRLTFTKGTYGMRILLFAAFNAVLTMAWAQSPDGRMTFQSLCSGCHGVDGNGGEHAPSILPASPRRTMKALTRIIREGVPRKGMPAFKQLPDAELRALVAYMRTLQQRRGGRRGDARPATRSAYGWHGTRRLRARPHRPRVAAAHRRSADSSVAQSRANSIAG